MFESPRRRTASVASGGPLIVPDYLASGRCAEPSSLIALPEIVDIAVTALAHLDIEIDPAWDLDGRVNELRSGEERR